MQEVINHQPGDGAKRRVKSGDTRTEMRLPLAGTPNEVQYHEEAYSRLRAVYKRVSEQRECITSARRQEIGRIKESKEQTIAYCNIETHCLVTAVAQRAGTRKQRVTTDLAVQRTLPPDATEVIIKSLKE